MEVHEANLYQRILVKVFKLGPSKYKLQKAKSKLLLFSCSIFIVFLVGSTQKIIEFWPYISHFINVLMLFTSYYIIFFTKCLFITDNI